MEQESSTEDTLEFGADISYHKSSGTLTVMNDGTKPKTTKVDKTTTSKPFALWGPSNDLPDQIIEHTEKNPVLFRALEFNKSTHMGAGLCYYFIKADADGKRTVNIVEVEEIEDFLQENQAQMVQKSIVDDYETLGNIFPEFVMTKANFKIARIFRKIGSWSRWEKHNTSNEIEHLYYNSDFKNYKELDSSKIPALSQYFPYDDLMSREGKGYNFIFRIAPTTGKRFYYDLASAEVLMNSDWLEVSNMVPKVLKSLMKNLLGVKFVLYINEQYFHWKYGEADWKKMSAADRDKKRKEVKAVVDQYLSGEEAQGKTLLSGEVYIGANKMPGMRIEAVDDKMKQGLWIPEGQEAAANIFYGMGVDPATVGISNNGGKLNSGSEKKSAFWNTQATLFNERLITLSPWYFISRVNGWNTRYKEYGRLCWGYQDVDTSSTLDENPTGRTNVVKP